MNITPNQSNEIIAEIKRYKSDFESIYLTVIARCVQMYEETTKYKCDQNRLYSDINAGLEFLCKYFPIVHNYICKNCEIPEKRKRRGVGKNIYDDKNNVFYWQGESDYVYNFCKETRVNKRIKTEKIHNNTLQKIVKIEPLFDVDKILNNDYIRELEQNKKEEEIKVFNFNQQLDNPNKKVIDVYDINVSYYLDAIERPPLDKPDIVILSINEYGER